ncbi:MAG: hypothetical protein QOI03_431 [Solirubrobacteraceae bacterium]|nr:hypothetical protein [Solirubrobacteraceae bacterium]
MLVTGASGFVGALLVPRLRADGHDVRALARDPQRARRALARGDRSEELPGPPLELLAGDLFTGEGLQRALDGVEVAYYLIHSMERSPVGSMPFTERERVAAERFSAHAARAGVRRIVYLGGLQPRWSDDEHANGARPRARSSTHLASRETVQRILLGAVSDSLALRASIVIGAHSRSFRLLVRLVERLPVLPLPAWQRFRTQPIDARDMTEMLVRCASAEPGGRSLDVGGPDVLSYGEMLTRIADLMLLGRRSLALGVNLTPIAARIAAAIAGEDPELVLPLMEGLQGDLLPADGDAAAQLGVALHSFDAAVEHALREWEELEPLAAR